MMPILNIEIVTRPGETIQSELSRQLADQAGEIFASPPGGTWVKVSLIPRENYAENISLPEQVSPVFVSILKAKLPPPDILQVEVAKLTPAIARLCDRPEENIHILYLPEGAGRVAFGGKLLSG